MKHIGVLTKEVVEFLDIKPGGVYVDLTLGAGGHSLEIIKNLRSGTLIAFDVDQVAIENFRTNTLDDKESDSVKIHLINDNFTKLKDHLEALKIQRVNGIVADLGWSSDQLSSIKGLSFENDTDELDMRFDQNLGVKASDLLNALGSKQLIKLFSEFADFYGPRNQNLVNAIITFRKKALFVTVEDLKKVIEKAFGLNSARNNNDSYSRVFQALRIAVNQELTNLEEMLENSFNVLEKGGRLIVITFHSGESTIVKRVFKEMENKSEAKKVINKFGEIFLTPSVDELKVNIRARSAKLFAIEKI